MPAGNTGLKTVRGGETARCVAVVLGAVGMILLASGCVAHAPDGVREVRGHEQDDIPVPTSFELRMSKSPDQTGLVEPFRSWKAVYDGQGRLRDLPAWYIREMRRHGWEYTRTEEVGELKTLRFEKGSEFSLVQISREMDRAIGGRKNVVRVEIHPLGTEDRSVEENLDVASGRSGTSEMMAPPPRGAGDVNGPAATRAQPAGYIREEEAAESRAAVESASPPSREDDSRSVSHEIDEVERS